MEKFRASVDAIRRGEEPPEDGYRGEYMNALAQLDGDPVPPMLAQIEATLERFRVHFDTWALQSELEQRIAEFMPRLDTYEKDGAVWLRSSAYGDEDDRVIIRSPERGGTPTYRAADIVYLVDKLERGFDRAIYVLGADHHGTRKWYAAIARMLGYDPDRVEVLLYQLVHLTRGGEQTKISKRRGDVVFLDEFMDEVGVDAARWYLVSRGPDQTIEIDVDLAKEKTRRTPSTTSSTSTRGSPESSECGRGAGRRVRASRARRRGEEPDQAPRRAARGRCRGDRAARPAGDPELRDPRRRRLPSLLPEHRVLESDAQAFRLGLCRATQTVVARCLDLIGVEAPERM